METKLKNEPIQKLLWTLALPAICAQLVTLLYNFVDRIFIGQMENGVYAMAAIGICTPIVTIITAFTNLFGRGGSPLAAIEMGKNDIKKAERYLGNSFVLLVLSSLSIMAIVHFFKTEILMGFGASSKTLPYAIDYLSIYILGTFFVQLTVGMNDYITTQGFAKIAMTTTMSGALFNTLLDPLFIFGFDMGIRGAALATILSQMVSFIWVMHFLFGKQTTLHLSRQNMHLDPALIKDIVLLGASPFFMSASEGILVLTFNTQALKLGGDLAVSVIAILFSMFQFLLLPVEGVTQGCQPILSYNYGARHYDRVLQTIKLTLKSTLSYSIIATTCIVLFPQIFVGLFGHDQQLLMLGSQCLRIYIFGGFILGANSTFQQTYNALGAGGNSFFFAFFRKMILLIPLIYLLPTLFPGSVYVLVLAEPISDWLTTLTNGFCFQKFIARKLELSDFPLSLKHEHS